MADYNLSEAFAVIEDYLIDSMRRNMLRHIAQEQREYFSWSQWQADMLSGLREYKRENADKFKGIYPVIEQKIEDAMQEAYDTGEATQEQVILSAIRKGYTAYRPKNTQNGEFFRMNKRKMNALVTETQKSMTKATAAALRMANDQYRSIIFGAQVFYNAGAGTLWQAVDMASKKFLQAGLNCIEYRDGRRVNIASYAEMALRTANTRAYLHGEAAMRERYGIHTVIVNRHNAACPLCVPFQGRVFIDDVWGGGTAAEAQVKGYPLLSEAMAAGLYHPNCKDGHTTFFVGINEFHPPTSRMKEEQIRRYDLQQQQRYHERQIRKYKRLCQGTIDEETRIGYTKKLHEWQGRTQELIEANPGILRRSPPREQLRNIPEELGITPPRNPPGVEIFAQVRPSEPPQKDKVRQIIDVKAYSKPAKPPPAIGPSAAERRRDIERIKAKLALVKQKAGELDAEAGAARQKAQTAAQKAGAMGRHAEKIRQQSAQTVESIRAQAKLRDRKVTEKIWDAKLSAAEARRLRRIAEIDKTEARAAQRRCATLLKLDNGGKLKVSVETRTAHLTAIKVKPTPKSKPVATVSVRAKPPVTVSIADEQRRKDIETIRAKVSLVKQKAAEMEKEAQAAKQAAQVLDAKAQKATQKAERAQQTVEAIRAKTRLREQQVSKQVRDAKLSIAEARRLRSAAEIAKTEARAAQRRYATLMKMEKGNKVKVSATVKSKKVIPVIFRTPPKAHKIAQLSITPMSLSDVKPIKKIQSQTKPKAPGNTNNLKEMQQMFDNISQQKWQTQVRPEQREELDDFYRNMDYKRLKFWEKYGNLVKGKLYTKGGCDDAYYNTFTKRIIMNLSAQDPQSYYHGYANVNIVAFMHESGHLFDYALKIRKNLPELSAKLQDDFLHYAEKALLSTKGNPANYPMELSSRLNCQALADDRKKGKYRPLDYYINHYNLLKPVECSDLEFILDEEEYSIRLRRSGVTDIIGGLTNNLVKSGSCHETKYWKESKNNVFAEAIANMFEAYMCGGERYEEIKKFFPDSMKYFEDYLDKLVLGG